MIKKALIILAQGFEEVEAVTPIDVLRRGGVDVTVAGLDNMNIGSARNMVIHCSDILSNCKNNRYDAIILPGGGKGARHLAESQDVNELLQKFNAEGKIIAAICASPAVVLAPLGILNNKRAVCYDGMQTAFHETTHYCNDNVVRDGNIITSRSAGTSLEFSFVVLAALINDDIGDKVKKAMLIS